MRLKDLAADRLRTVRRRMQERSARRTFSFGDLRRTEPLNRDFGYSRGGPVDRRYIEEHLAAHRRDIRGNVLDVANDYYARTFGGDAVIGCDVLDIDSRNPDATIIADLAVGDGLSSDAYDCVVLTQVLQLIYDLQGAVRTIHRVLKPGGVALVTVPGISRIDHARYGDTWYWSFTVASLKRALGDVFGTESVVAEARGNVLTSTAFLYGAGAGELTTDEYERHDPDYPMVVVARAVKRTGR